MFIEVRNNGGSLAYINTAKIESVEVAKIGDVYRLVLTVGNGRQFYGVERYRRCIDAENALANMAEYVE